MKSVRVSVKTWRNRKFHKAVHTKPAEIPEGTAFVSDSLSDKKYRKNISQGLEDLRSENCWRFEKHEKRFSVAFPLTSSPSSFRDFAHSLKGIFTAPFL